MHICLFILRFIRFIRYIRFIRFCQKFFLILSRGISILTFFRSEVEITYSQLRVIQFLLYFLRVNQFLIYCWLENSLPYYYVLIYLFFFMAI